MTFAVSDWWRFRRSLIDNEGSCFGSMCADRKHGAYHVKNEAKEETPGCCTYNSRSCFGNTAMFKNGGKVIAIVFLCGVEDFVPRLMPTTRKLPTAQQPSVSLLVAAARQHIRSSPSVVSNIQPFRRQSHRLQPQLIHVPATVSPRAHTAHSDATNKRPSETTAEAVQFKSHPRQQSRQQCQPRRLDVRPSAPLQRRVQSREVARGAPRLLLSRLGSGVQAAAGALAWAATVPIRAASHYVPFGLEVHLFPPHSDEPSRHAAILAGMTRSLLCPTGDLLCFCSVFLYILD